MFQIAALCLLLTAGNLFSFGRAQAIGPAPDYRQAVEAAAPERIERPEITRAEQVMRALAQAYPWRIEKVEFHNGDWAVFMEGAWYYYAGGRLLPEELLYMAEDYSPQSFYNYQRDLPAWTRPTPEEAARYSSMAGNRSTEQRKRSTHFFDSLWRARSRDESYQRLKTIRFLGRNLNIHYAIMEDLAIVEERILEAAKTDSSVQAWVNNISTLDAWSWRNIADSQSRSYHAYGIAIDILPASLGGKETYWLWTANHRPDWWNASYSERFHPPNAVIRAFEDNGFIWGGKWLLFDTMHFEYRPEVLILNGMPPSSIH
jgi:hypothetical protein